MIFNLPRSELPGELGRGVDDWLVSSSCGVVGRTGQALDDDDDAWCDDDELLRPRCSASSCWSLGCT